MNGNGGFNTLEYAQELEGAGVPKKQAEIQARAFYKAFDSQVATKQDIALIQRDIEELKTANNHGIALIQKDIEYIRAESKQNIKELETSLKKDIELLRRDMIIKLGGLLVLGLTVLGTLLKFWITPLSNIPK